MASDNFGKIHPLFDDVLKPIGEGGYGDVYLVQHEYELVARKDVDYSLERVIDCGGKKIIERVINPNEETKFKVDSTIGEIDVLRKLSHENVITLKDSYIDTECYKIYIYSEYYSNGDLWKMIDKMSEKKEDFSLEV